LKHIVHNSSSLLPAVPELALIINDDSALLGLRLAATPPAALHFIV
jgi:hypothetical protein